ncbi:DUF1127 domain-containing protein [Vibrio sp. THAF190c]|uniref:DUF1127 domain-containing protein n=1 Tax=Vibrio sp. THAF190c TaxID=2587865 RepID=UPI001267BED9|nr:DUF1127 domain-containing protein [Vibrio sp. THAF190c]QFT10660.1 hypothetical protein FIV04_11795 [Vibrio sp. THAF190c]
MNSATVRVELDERSNNTSLIKKFYFKVQQFRQNAKTRKHLAALPDHLLNDIGLTHTQAQQEARKVFWE